LAKAGWEKRPNTAPSERSPEWSVSEIRVKVRFTQRFSHFAALHASYLVGGQYQNQVELDDTVEESRMALDRGQQIRC
jgi:hypothetical protein